MTTPPDANPSLIARWHERFERPSSHLLMGALLYPLIGLGFAWSAPQVPLWAHLPALLLAVALWDLSSGFIHWLFDILPTNHPILGHLAATFQLHHVEPRRFLEWSLWTNCKYDHLAALPVIGALLLIHPPAFALEVGAIYTLLGSFSEWFHAFGHGAHANRRVVRALQRAGVLLSPRHHGRHHAPPHTMNYCIFNGMCDPLLNRFAAWLRGRRGVVA